MLFVLSACSSTAENAATTAEDPNPSLRYLAFGDSYTIGEGVAPDQRWTVLLGRELESGGFSLVDVQIVAQTGWTTSESDTAIDHSPHHDGPSMRIRSSKSSPVVTIRSLCAALM